MCEGGWLCVHVWVAGWGVCGVCVGAVAGWGVRACVRACVCEGRGGGTQYTHKYIYIL